MPALPSGVQHPLACPNCLVPLTFTECDHKQTVARHDGGREQVNGFHGSSRTDSDKGAMNYRDLCGKCGARRIDAQIGLEPTPDCLGWATKVPCGQCYVCVMVAVFREVKRILRDDGVLFLNLGDSYAGHNLPGWREGNEAKNGGVSNKNGVGYVPGLKPKDLCGIPWRVAFALQADGWYLRSDIIWAKPNPMPESVQDRPTRSHEYLFLLAKSERYFYDSSAIREAAEYGRCGWTGNAFGRNRESDPRDDRANSKGSHANGSDPSAGRNRRDVWTVNSEPTPEAHFATFPQALVTPCVLAGTSEKGCCAECGAPRVRVTEYHRNGKDWNANNRAGGDRLRVGQSASDGMPSTYQPPTTLGWQPSCAHDAPSIPCVVFDPFGGTSTVGLVAERFGRRWVTLELSSEYVRLAKQRTRQLGLFGAAQFQPGALSSVESVTVAPNSPIGHQACFDFDDEESSRAE